MPEDRLQEVLRRVRRIEVLMRGLVRERVAGEYHSCFRGQGIDFDEFREYQAGDEVRAIDWNVTARMGTPYIKKFTEERELTVYIVVDISGSGNFGSRDISKRELAAEIGALLAFSAQRHQDKVGLVLFSHEVDLYVPPRKGHIHCLRLLREILYRSPQAGGTSMSAPLQFLLKRVPRRSLVFFISDFHGAGLEDALGPVAVKHDVIAIQLADAAELNLPRVGRITLTNPETSRQIRIQTNSPRVREAYQEARALWQENLDSICKKARVEKIELQPGMDYVPALRAFFKRRAARNAPA